MVERKKPSRGTAKKYRATGGPADEAPRKVVPAMPEKKDRIKMLRRATTRRRTVR